MNHKNIAGVLKIAGWIALAGILTIFYCFVPVQAVRTAEGCDGIVWSAVLMMLLGLPYLIGIGYYFAVCGKIAMNRSFSRENVRYMHRIALVMCISACMWLIAVILLFVCGEGCGILNAFCIVTGTSPIFVRIIALLAAGASLAVSMVARMLSMLLTRAEALQTESDLTI